IEEWQGCSVWQVEAVRQEPLIGQVGHLLFADRLTITQTSITPEVPGDVSIGVEQFHDPRREAETECVISTTEFRRIRDFGGADSAVRDRRQSRHLSNLSRNLAIAIRSESCR